LGFYLLFNFLLLLLIQSFCQGIPPMVLAKKKERKRKKKELWNLNRIILMDQEKVSRRIENFDPDLILLKGQGTIGRGG